MGSNKRTPLPLPSQSLLREALDYCPDTGIAVHKSISASYFGEFVESGPSLETRVKRRNSRLAGKIAGRQREANGKRYLIVCLNSKAYYLHRIIWKWMTGSDPVVIDHIDHDPTNNRWGNLRSVAPSDNSRNQSRPSTSTHNFVGVRFEGVVKGKPWRARIQVDGKTVCLGRFSTEIEAVEARASAERRYAFHENHGL